MTDHPLASRRCGGVRSGGSRGDTAPRDRRTRRDGTNGPADRYEHEHDDAAWSDSVARTRPPRRINAAQHNTSQHNSKEMTTKQNKTNKDKRQAKQSKAKRDGYSSTHNRQRRTHDANTRRLSETTHTLIHTALSATSLRPWSVSVAPHCLLTRNRATIPA